MTQLGSYDTTIMFIDHNRGPLGTVISRDLSGVTWNRAKNEFTQATVNLSAGRSLANDLEPWLHQLAIFRDDEPVWRGFVFNTSAQDGKLSVTARDPSSWFSKRRVERSRGWYGVDPTTIAAEVIRDALAAFDPFGMSQYMVEAPTGLFVNYEVKKDAVLVAEVLKDLVDVGLQWTVTGGRLVLGPAPRAHTTAGLDDSHFDTLPTVEKDGSAVVNDLLILGKGASGQYFDYGSGFAGALQGIEKADALTTEFQCVNEARDQVRSRTVATRRISMPGNSRLMPNAPVSVEELVPGCLVPIATNTTGILVASRLELSEMSVKAGRSGDEVSVTLVDAPVTEQLQQQRSPTDIEVMK